jgi:hypothetical protein
MNTSHEPLRYEDLKAERDRYVEHIKSLVDERNRAFNREDDLKNVIFEARKSLAALKTNAILPFRRPELDEIDDKLKEAIKGWRGT